MDKLWGDNFFDPATKKWTKKPTGAAGCKRGFVQFIYEPIKTIIDACMNDNKARCALPPPLLLVACFPHLSLTAPLACPRNVLLL